MLIILCIILFRISCNSTALCPNNMHYSQDYSQNHYQNSVVTFKMIATLL